jgi:hypothetical protein
LHAELDKAGDPHCLENYYLLYPGRVYRHPRWDADSGRSRSRIRNDVARQSNLISLGVPG